MVKRLRHRPFTAVTGVRFPLGSPLTLINPFLGPMVKRLRHRPFTAVTGVRFPLGSGYKSTVVNSAVDFLFCLKFAIAVVFTLTIPFSRLNICAIVSYALDLSEYFHRNPICLHASFYLRVSLGELHNIAISLR